MFAAAGHSASRGAGGGRALLSPLPPASTVVLAVRGVPAHVHSSHWVRCGVKTVLMLGQKNVCQILEMVLDIKKLPLL